MIELTKLRTVVSKFIQASLDEFGNEHQGVELSCIGLFVQGFYGSVTVFADTSAHAEPKLRDYDKWLADQKKDKASIEIMGKTGFRRWIQVMERRGKDSMGRFNISCNDFEYSVGVLQFPDWPDPDSETADEEKWVFKWPDGRITSADMSKGDAGIDHEIFPTLVECLDSVDTSRLKTEAIFRIGVEMHDETYVKFWVPKNMQHKGYEPYEYCYTDLGT